MKNHEQAIASATAAVEQAKDKRIEAENALKSAEAELALRMSERKAAMINRDKELPQAVVVSMHRGVVSNKTPVCVVRKTEKTAFVRYIGGEESHISQFREKDGEWKPYPAQKQDRWIYFSKKLVFDASKKVKA